MVLSTAPKYQEQLRHIRRPDKQTERLSAPSIMLSDYEALYLRTALLEYGAYQAPTDSHRAVAEAYGEYIDESVRNHSETSLRLYAHTQTAREVLNGATNVMSKKQTDMKLSIIRAVEQMRSEVEDE